MATHGLEKMADVIGRHSSGEGGLDTPVPGLLLVRRSAPSEFLPVLYPASLCFVAQGAKEVRLAAETYRYDTSHALLVSVDLPAASRVVEASAARPYLAVRVSLDPVVVGEFLAEGLAPLRPAPPERAVGAVPVDPPLLDAVTRLATLLDAPADIPALAPFVVREITYRLLTGPQGPRLRQVAAVGGSAHRIVRAVQWLTGHFAEPLKVEAVAKHVGMSVSAFHLHFKSLTTMSPLQYQKRLRLQEARRLMMGEGLDAAQAAFRVGYQSASQFGREYLRMFGASPRQDVAALKVPARPMAESVLPPGT